MNNMQNNLGVRTDGFNAESPLTSSISSNSLLSGGEQMNKNFNLVESSQIRSLSKQQDAGMAIITCLISAFFLVLFALACSLVHADVIPEERAVMAIIGEAENQGSEGMLAVACVIRNRYHRYGFKGIYGEKSPRVVKRLYSDKIYAMAKKAWKLSASKDITGGATNWENIKAFGKPCWANRCVEVFRHKDHVFYREV
jgi:hypothetical protein